jgi:hypothetical protein
LLSIERYAARFGILSRIFYATIGCISKIWNKEDPMKSMAVFVIRIMIFFSSACEFPVCFAYSLVPGSTGELFGDGFEDDDEHDDYITRFL